MSVYYINPISALRKEGEYEDYHVLALVPGDTVLFRRGSQYHSALDTVPGVTYGSYGEGELPVFSGAFDLSGEDCWKETAPHIWRSAKLPVTEVGNIIFNGTECTATLRWEKESLCQQGDFWDSAFGTCNVPGGAYVECSTDESRSLFLYSEENPGKYYRTVEAVCFDHRILGRLSDGITIEKLRFEKAGVHALQGWGDRITVRGCEFFAIGGCVWSKKLHIRFGNAVEFWDYGNDITVEDCTFLQVYDSCVTYQGSEKCAPTRRFCCRRNVFDSYGMAAFEYRDRVPVESCFSKNFCRNAGCGFAMRGEVLPRKSEIWPQPMGHHIFLWRMEAPSEGGGLAIDKNRFGAAPNGAAVYSIIAPEAEAQITFRDNIWEGQKLLACRWGGKNYDDAETFLREKSAQNHDF